ncbi:uncharacterized protein M6B38_301865 [Iris pallida]|uniref:Uncharacterized protein n=1 Tax=Iris pallida TaxID=29817 RepID=A0AAX6HP41_IRIPA|nr:uncharacterized protein M6B38_301865 [Iris pallida]
MKKWLVSKMHELKLEVEDEEEEDQYEEQELNEEGDREDEGEQEQNEKEDGVSGTVRILDPVSKKRKGRPRSLRIKRRKRTANKNCISIVLMLPHEPKSLVQVSSNNRR